MKRTNILLASLCTLTALAAASCGNKNAPASSGAPASSSTAPTSSKKTDYPGYYIITVFNVGGAPMVGTTLTLKKGSQSYECVVSKYGTCKFEIPEDVYTMELSGFADGYYLDETLTTTLGVYTYDIEVKNRLREGTPGKSEWYHVGDIAYDFSYTDIDGNELSLKKLLADKKMVILNAFYIDCYYCNEEFPYVEQFYKKYSNDLSFIAGTIDSRDTVEAVDEYRDEMGLTFNFLVGEVDFVTLTGATMPNRGFPSTVIIDRYGFIANVHLGGMPSVQQWEKLVKPILADDYVPSFED